MTRSRSFDLRSVFSGSIVQLIGLPVTLGAGLLNTSLIVAHTGKQQYGLVSTVATLALLFPFADLGVGQAVTTACARAGLDREYGRKAVATVRFATALLVVVAALGVSVSAVLAATGGWDRIFGTHFSEEDRLLIALSVSAFFLGVPLSLSARVLIGVGRNGIATVLSMAGGLFALAVTSLFIVIGAPPMAYSISGFGGPTLASLVAVPVALWALNSANITPHGPTARRRAHRAAASWSERWLLLAGSGWMVLVMIGLPLGLQTGRLIVAHTQSAVHLSSFALGAQLYGIAWGMHVTAGNALWAMFARERENADLTFRAWRKMVLIFGALSTAGGLFLTFAGPPIARWISGGRIDISTVQMAAFSVLLVVQAIHLPGGVLLTMPHELRWQAACTGGLALVSLALGVLTAPQWGGPAVSLAAATGVLVAQVIPDMFWVRRFLAQREGNMQAAAVSASV